mmetsp:Transcript_2505/g.7922  ORF Transcript_2505/g.7922 Transcript_2505/m.7922 type:complete len:109 (+) Transcript_2505:108-434(+)|eukprot:scaffold164022_cov32-Tisochrysis_lutea.AAC.2
MAIAIQIGLPPAPVARGTEGPQYRQTAFDQADPQIWHRDHLPLGDEEVGRGSDSFTHHLSRLDSLTRLEQYASLRRVRRDSQKSNERQVSCYGANFQEGDDVIGRDAK